jgi:hypothetical protein
MRKRAMTWKAFARKFRPAKNHLDDNASLDGCMFETYGKEDKFVRSFFHTPDMIWTVLNEPGKREEYIVPGYHTVNRMGYILTVNPWTDEDLWVLA